MKVLNKAQAILGAVAMLVLGQTAQANLINITKTDLPAGITPVTGGPIISSDLELANQGQTTVFNWLSDQIVEYNTLNGTQLSAPKDEILLSGTTTSGLNLSAYEGEYIVVHWGLGQAGQLSKALKGSAGFEQAFYIDPNTDNTSISLILPSLSNGSKTKNVGGLSFWRVYDPPPQVPESGLTLSLLGFAMCLTYAIRARAVKV